MRIDFSPPDMTDAEVEAVADVLRSGWITTGQKVRALEAALAKLGGADGAICLNSGTAALELSLRLLGIGPGDEVITTAYTYSATAAAILHVGATPVLTDLRGDSYHLVAEMMAPLVTPRTKAVIPVDFAGILCDYEAIKAELWRQSPMFRPENTAQEALGRVAVIADAAHAVGAVHRGVSCGGLADLTCLSFHAVKNVTTAEGGAILWRNHPALDSAEIYRQLSLLSLHGQTKTALEKRGGAGWEYDIALPGYKCNMTDIAAAIGLVQLGRYPAMLERRRQLVNVYDRALTGRGILLPNHGLEGETLSSCHLYPIYIPGIGEAERNRLIAALVEQNIDTNVHYKPLPMLTAYRKLDFSIDHYPAAYRRFAGEITLPLHSGMTEGDAARVAEELLRAMDAQGLLGARNYRADRVVLVDGEKT